MCEAVPARADHGAAERDLTRAALNPPLERWELSLTELQERQRQSETMKTKLEWDFHSLETEFNITGG